MLKTDEDSDRLSNANDQLQFMENGTELQALSANDYRANLNIIQTSKLPTDF